MSLKSERLSKFLGDVRDHLSKAEEAILEVEKNALADNEERTHAIETAIAWCYSAIEATWTP